jgi:two-component system response regulator RegX3
MRIVIVNSETGSGDLLSYVLREAGHDTVVAHGRAGLREATTQETDVVFVRADDISTDGCRYCMQLRARRYTGPIIFVSRQNTMRQKVRAFDHGADDYIVEPYDPLELIARLNAVARRSQRVDGQIPEEELRVGDISLSLGTLTVTVGDQSPKLLTPTEMRVLESLLRSPDITISRETLIERTWGYDFVGEDNRLDVNILRLRKKLEHDPANPVYLHTVRGVGYVIRPMPYKDRSMYGPPPVAQLVSDPSQSES